MKNLRYDVNWPVLIFGNGLQAILVDYRKFVDRDGVDMVEVVLRPTYDLVLHYGLVDADYDDFQRGLLRKSYPASFFSVLNPSLSCGRYFLWCGFKGEKVDLDVERVGLGEKLISLERVNNSLKKENSFLLGVLRDKTSQISKLEDDELKRFNKISSSSKTSLSLEPYMTPEGGEQR